MRLCSPLAATHERKILIIIMVIIMQQTNADKAAALKLNVKYFRECSGVVGRAIEKLNIV